MIDWLRLSKSGHFYSERRRLPKAAIAALFASVRSRHRSPSKNIFSHIKVQHGHATWSGISFFYERHPSFLETLPPNHMRERICGFLFLVEYKDHVAVFRSGLDLPAEVRAAYLAKLSSASVEQAIAKTDVVFEKIRLRNMGASKYALRSKTLEAANLQSVVGPSGTQRFVPQNYRVRNGRIYVSATPSTGRISERSERATHMELVDWSISVIDELTGQQGTATSAFIRRFARPVSLSTLAVGPAPTFFAIDVPTLTDELFEADEAKRLVRTVGGVVTALDRAAAELVLEALDQPFSVRKVGGSLRVLDEDNEKIGELRVGNSKISLRTFAIPEIADLSIETADGPIGRAPDNVSLKRYIDRSDKFMILFDDFSLTYIEGSLYRDEQIVDGGMSLLSYLRPFPELAAVTSEKGTFAAGQVAFDNDSVFAKVVHAIAVKDDVLVCDDLGDEWADFIGICTTTTPKSISFYHAKHDELTLGAGSFHVAVSQAMKNLGRLTLPAEAMNAKFQSWADAYRGVGVQTAIARVQRGTLPGLEQVINETRSSPDTIRRVFIVTSSLSYKAVQDAFAAIKVGTRPRPHFIQLYWLLTTFFSACAEVGALAYIACAP